MRKSVFRRRRDPRPHGSVDCIACSALCEVPASYYMGMDLNTCKKRTICPCMFDPVRYTGCIHDTPSGDATCD